MHRTPTTSCVCRRTSCSPRKHAPHIYQVLGHSVTNFHCVVSTQNPRDLPCVPGRRRRGDYLLPTPPPPTRSSGTPVTGGDTVIFHTLSLPVRPVSTTPGRRWTSTSPRPPVSPPRRTVETRDKRRTISRPARGVLAPRHVLVDHSLSQKGLGSVLLRGGVTGGPFVSGRRKTGTRGFQSLLSVRDFGLTDPRSRCFTS